MRRTRGFRRSSRSSSRPVRAREWEGFVTSPSGIFGEPGRIVLAPNTGYCDWALDPNDLRDFYDEPTIVRTIIHDQVHPLASSAGGVSIACSLYVGLIAWKDDNLPVVGPFADDATKDWMYHTMWNMFNGGTSDGFINAGPTVNPDGRLDLKSKRKFQSGMGLALCAFAPTNNSHSVVWQFNARCLLLNG